MPRGKPVPRPVTIYALMAPETGRPRYVGHTTRLQDRVGSHWSTRGKGSRPVSTWLGSLSDPPSYVVLETDVPFEERYEAEAFWTVLLRQRGEKLLNLSVGARISPEHAAKATAAGRRALAAKRQRERESRPVVTAPRRKPMSAEARRNIGNAKRGLRLDETHRARIAASVTAWHARRRLTEAPIDTR